jgi:hypothetical protein
LCVPDLAKQQATGETDVLRALLSTSLWLIKMNHNIPVSGKINGQELSWQSIDCPHVLLHLHLQSREGGLNETGLY